MASSGYNSINAESSTGSPTLLQRTVAEIATAWFYLKEGVKTIFRMKALQLLGMLAGVLFVIVGNTGQLLAVNEWMNLFTNGGTPWITVLTITATSTTLFFTLCWIAWVFVKRPHIGWMWDRKCIGLAFVAGFGNATNGVLIISATPHTPEILQAFLLSTIVIWTFFLMKVAVRDQRSYISPLVITSFLFCVAGVVLGSASQFSNESMTTKRKIWTVIFESGMFMAALYNVFVYVFLDRFSTTMGRTLSGQRILSRSGRKLASSRSNPNLADDESVPFVKSEPGSPESPAQVPVAKVIDFHLPQRASTEFEDSITVKLSMLFMTGITQTIFMWMYVPLDALPWFGTSANITEAYSNLALGYRCVFGGACGGNGLYGFLFCFFYVFNYFGSAYLNSYSAAVTSMVNQLGSPIAAITLLMIPAWNVSQPPMPINLGESIGAIFFLTIGTIAYTAWEEGTKQQALLTTEPDSGKATSSPV